MFWDPGQEVHNKTRHKKFPAHLERGSIVVRKLSLFYDSDSKCCSKMGTIVHIQPKCNHGLNPSDNLLL